MISPLFNLSAILPADQLHVYSEGKAGQQIKAIIGSKGSHDALVISPSRGIGESVAWPPRAKITPFEQYEQKMRAGRLWVSVLRIPDISLNMRARISTQWVRDVRGTLYDYAAFPRLYLKARVGDIIPTEAGWEWANWCTEGIAKSIVKASDGAVDPYHKKNPTPLTTEKRQDEGEFIDVTEECLTAEGLKYRLQL